MLAQKKQKKSAKNSLQAVVLAAGQGVRMRPLTDDKPKALVLLNGKPLLWHVLRSLEKAGVKETIIVIGFKGELVKKEFGSRLRKMRLQYVVQNVAMGTAHALFQARKLVKGRFLVGYCDVIVEPGLWKKLAGIKRKQVVVALRREEHPERFGVALVSGKRLTGIIEKPVENLKSNLVNAGAYLFTEKIFPELEKIKISVRNEFELTDGINAMAVAGKAGFVVYNGKCFDIGTIEDLQAANGKIKQKN